MTFLPSPNGVSSVGERRRLPGTGHTLHEIRCQTGGAEKGRYQDQQGSPRDGYAHTRKAQPTRLGQSKGDSPQRKAKQDDSPGPQPWQGRLAGPRDALHEKQGANQNKKGRSDSEPARHPADLRRVVRVIVGERVKVADHAPRGDDTQ